MARPPPAEHRCRYRACGAIVATMLFVQRIHNGTQVAGFALAPRAVIVVLCLVMRFCGLVKRVLRDSGVELLTRISGLLPAIAVLLVAEAVQAFVKQG
ncbi:MAG TPA: MarC family protein [Streptosporangiaceae bacterium]|nr:MarC family protein [Streptosporangiaceae bacterium]